MIVSRTLRQKGQASNSYNRIDLFGIEVRAAACGETSDPQGNRDKDAKPLVAVSKATFLGFVGSESPSNFNKGQNTLNKELLGLEAVILRLIRECETALTALILLQRSRIPTACGRTPAVCKLNA